MNITRDVITDLLPLYLAGEASEDSNMLIQKFLENDPSYAKMVLSTNENEGLNKDLFSQKLPFEADLELKALEKTKRLLNLRGWLLGFALFSTACLFGIRNIGNGIEWIWSGFLIGFSVCLVIAFCSWVSYFVVRHRLIKVGV